MPVISKGSNRSFVQVLKFFSTVYSSFHFTSGFLQKSLEYENTTQGFFDTKYFNVKSNRHQRSSI